MKTVLMFVCPYVCAHLHEPDRAERLPERRDLPPDGRRRQREPRAIARRGPPGRVEALAVEQHVVPKYLRPKARRVPV